MNDRNDESDDQVTEDVKFDVNIKIDKDSKSSEKFECKECGKHFRLSTGLRRHLLKHGKKIICEVCGKGFTCKWHQI